MVVDYINLNCHKKPCFIDHFKIDPKFACRNQLRQIYASSALNQTLLTLL
uniref:Uncharacterized protein n=1 Tax=Romanomermis culicivorax TaxID=13658 RepID=A0A915J1X5_ROMCU